MDEDDDNADMFEVGDDLDFEDSSTTRRAFGALCMHS